MTISLQGIFAPITTPFNSDGSLNLERLAENTDKYAATGIAGYLALGSNGENKSLTTTEKEQVLKTIIAHKAPGQTVMAGSIFESTGETIDFALTAQESGADYITLLPPSYFKSAMKDLVLLKYFTDVADVIKVPCLLYKAPHFSGGVDISPSLVKECAKHSNIVGMKDSSSSGIEKLLLDKPDNFTILSGSANTFFNAMLLGASGGVISLANYLPQTPVALYNLILSGNLAGASELNKKIIRCNIAVSGAYGVAGVKRAMDLAGFYGGPPRLPLPPFPHDADETIHKALVPLT